MVLRSTPHHTHVVLQGMELPSALVVAEGSIYLPQTQMAFPTTKSLHDQLRTGSVQPLDNSPVHEEQ